MSTNSKLVIFMGPPGSGKGSLSQLCVQKFGWIQLSTGFLCRKHISEQTEIGKQIDFSIKSGKLISDELIVAMVEQWLDEYAGQQAGVILDGFPRTVAQAKSLQRIIDTKLPYSRLRIVKLLAADDIIINRLLARYVCASKDCQAVYSIHAASSLASKKPNICDICSNSLIRRSDDDESIIRERLNTYHGVERYLIDFYKNYGKKIHKINVNKPLDKVFEEFKNIIAEN